MSNPTLEPFLITADSTVHAAMEAIDRGAERICLVVDQELRLTGVVTDGDLRRGLLAGVAMGDPVGPLVSAHPLTVPPSETRAAVLELMRARKLDRIPIVDGQGVLVGLHTMSGLVSSSPRDNVAVVFAGGRGTRLGELTAQTPKPMMTVAGRPILERLVLHLVGAGIQTVYLAVNYLADVIEAHFGDGDALGCSIRYLRESPDLPLGPGGALSLLAPAVSDGGISAPVLLLNGDLVTSADLGDLLDYHASSGSVATLAAHDYAHEVPFGVVESDESGRLLSFEEKPVASWRINAGLYVLEPELVQRVPPNTPYTVPALLMDSVGRGERVSVWNMRSDWIDVGRPDDLELARTGKVER